MLILSLGLDAAKSPADAARAGAAAGVELGVTPRLRVSATAAVYRPDTCPGCPVSKAELLLDAADPAPTDLIGSGLAQARLVPGSWDLAPGLTLDLDVSVGVGAARSEDAWAYDATRLEWHLAGAGGISVEAHGERLGARIHADRLVWRETYQGTTRAWESPTVFGVALTWRAGEGRRGMGVRS